MVAQGLPHGYAVDSLGMHRDGKNWSQTKERSDPHDFPAPRPVIVAWVLVKHCEPSMQHFVDKNVIVELFSAKLSISAEGDAWWNEMARGQANTFSIRHEPPLYRKGRELSVKAKLVEAIKSCVRIGPIRIEVFVDASKGGQFSFGWDSDFHDYTSLRVV